MCDISRALGINIVDPFEFRSYFNQKEKKERKKEKRRKEGREKRGKSKREKSR